MIEDRGLGVYLCSGSPDLFSFSWGQISIIASLFSGEPRNTQSEVMSPSLVVEFNLLFFAFKVVAETLCPDESCSLALFVIEMQLKVTLFSCLSNFLQV